MKRTQFTDALRNIWKQKVSFLSIVVIAALGVTMFLGIDFSASAIRKNASSFYNEQNYRDMELVSTLLLSEDDLMAIRGTEGVTDAEGVCVTNAKASANDVRTSVDVISVTERINLPIVYEGRLPETETECAIEQKLADSLGLRPGDTLAITNAKGGAAQYLSGRNFVVTGVVVHPDHTCYNVPFTPYVMVTPGAFDSESLNDCCMKAEIVTAYAANAARFDRAYTQSVGTVLTKLSDLGTTRGPIRDAQAKDTIAENRQKLADAEQDLKDARARLDQGHADLEDSLQKYADGERDLQDARAKLDDAKRQLTDGERELQDSRAQLDDAKADLEAGAAELADAKQRLDAGRAELVSGWNQLENAKAQMRLKLRDAVESAFGSETADAIAWAYWQSAQPDSESACAHYFWITRTFKIRLDPSLTLHALIEAFVYSDKLSDDVLQKAYAYAYPDEPFDPAAAREMLADTLNAVADTVESGYLQLINGCAQWDDGHRTYLNGKAQYEEGLRTYEDGLKQYEDGEAQYAEGLQTYEDSLKAYNDGEEQYKQGQMDLASAREQLADAKQMLLDGEAEYADGLQKFEDGKVQLSDAEERIASLGACKWIIVDGSGNASFTQLDTAGSNLKSMEMTFSLMFVLVGALVIYATISKMVDEQRSLVGTTKALGFFNREIFLKYMLFGVSATVLGAALGFVLATALIQGFALNGYNSYFAVDLSRRTVKLLPTLLVFLFSVLLAAAAIWFATQKLIRESAIRLMQQAVPKGAKKASAAKKRLLSLYSRLILLNIRSDLRRVLVTVVSVAGCCALVIIGVTLQQAVKRAEVKQYDEIILHDGTVWFDPDADPTAAAAIEERLTQAGAESVPVMHTYVTVQFKNIDLQELYCGDLAAISNLYALKDAKTGAPIELSDDGVYVTKRFYENYGVQTGDTFTLSLNGTETVEVRVAGVFDNYMNRHLFLSDRYFSTLFGRDAEPNAFYVRMNGADSDALVASLRSIAGFMSYDAADTTRALFRSATAVLNGIVLLFIGMAGIMAGVVLMNLTNIYILQKKRELTIMRVNGFTVKEVIGYVLRETVVTTAVGILLGIVLGSAVGYKIVRSMEQSFIQFDRSLSPLAWLVGAVITVAFTIIINTIVLRKVKHLKLTDLT